jgi:hypothetical protein
MQKYGITARESVAAEERVEFKEDRIPSSDIEEAIEDLVELYGGEVQGRGAQERQFVLPMRRGVPTSGGVGCTISWIVGENNEATVTLVCDRDVEAPKLQRIALLSVGVIGALLFTLWPFFGKHAATALGTLAWAGGLVAIAVYLMTLKRTPGGIAHDFLQRLARRQREAFTAGQ